MTQNDIITFYNHNNNFVKLLVFFSSLISVLRDAYTRRTIFFHIKPMYNSRIFFNIFFFVIAHLNYPSLSGVLLLVGGVAWWLWLWLCSSSMYVMLSDRGRPRVLVLVRKLCMERRSSRSSSVDLKARITRSCKHTNTTRVSCEVCFFWF